jgi:hypothetical protein
LITRRWRRIVAAPVAGLMTAVLATTLTPTAAYAAPPTLTIPPAPSYSDTAELQRIATMAGRVATSLDTQGYAATLAFNTDPLDHGKFRLLSNVALGHAIGYRMPSAVGLTSANVTRRDIAIAIIRKALAFHLADRTSNLRCDYGTGTAACPINDSAIIAAQIGEAAYLLYNNLTATDQANLRTFLGDLSLRVTGHDIYGGATETNELKVYRNVADTVVGEVGNSYAEELPWAERLLNVTTIMYPDHVHIGHFKRMRAAFGANAFAMPQDAKATNTATRNGQPYCRWLIGSNLEGNGALVNHGRIHPGYARAPHNWASWSLAGAAKQPASPFTVDRVAALWSGNLYKYPYPSTPHPGLPVLYAGGESYQQSGTIYYPQGHPDQGGAKIVEPTVGDYTNTVQSHYVGYLAGAPTIMVNQGNKVQAQQQADGSFSTDPGGYSKLDKDADAYVKLTQTYWTAAVRQHTPPSTSTETLQIPVSGTAC